MLVDAEKWHVNCITKYCYFRQVPILREQYCFEISNLEVFNLLSIGIVLLKHFCLKSFDFKFLNFKNFTFVIDLRQNELMYVKFIKFSMSNIFRFQFFLGFKVWNNCFSKGLQFNIVCITQAKYISFNFIKYASIKNIFLNLDLFYSLIIRKLMQTSRFIFFSKSSSN